MAGSEHNILRDFSDLNRTYSVQRVILVKLIIGLHTSSRHQMRMMTSKVCCTRMWFVAVASERPGNIRQAPPLLPQAGTPCEFNHIDTESIVSFCLPSSSEGSPGKGSVIFIKLLIQCNLVNFQTRNFPNNTRCQHLDFVLIHDWICLS